MYRFRYHPKDAANYVTNFKTISLWEFIIVLLIYCDKEQFLDSPMLKKQICHSQRTYKFGTEKKRRIFKVGKMENLIPVLRKTQFPQIYIKLTV